MEVRGRANTLQSRLFNIETRLRAMNTVTNTASSEISGGETIIDENGSLIFHSGGTLVIGNSSISSGDAEIITSDGNLVADTVTISGDVLSASDYDKQREATRTVLLSTDVVGSTSINHELEFPDWASYASVWTNVVLRTRVRTPNSNPVLITVNGSPLARPRSSDIGDVQTDVTGFRRITPDNPYVRVAITMAEDSVPIDSPEMYVEQGVMYLV